MKTIAYLRISTNKQDVDGQKLAILDYIQKCNIKVDEFMEVQISSKKSNRERRIEELLQHLQPGDILIVSELSRLGRSLGQIVQLVDRLIRNKVKFVAIKEGIDVDGKQDMRSKVMVVMFGLFAELERDLISERTKEGLAAARMKGKRLGRPKGSLGRSKLDGRENEIKIFLEKKVSKASIAKIMDVSRTALYSFIKSRKLT